MLELFVQRISSGTEATLGIMHDVTDHEDRQFQCYVLEDQHNEPKIPGETRIPAGRYEIKLRTEDSPMNKRYHDRFPWHKGMLWLQNVPGFTFVYIHVGNKDDDSDACLLVGDGQVSNVVERGQVTSSVTAYTRLYNRIISATDVWIEIENYA